MQQCQRFKIDMEMATDALRCNSILLYFMDIEVEERASKTEPSLVRRDLCCMTCCYLLLDFI